MTLKRGSSGPDVLAWQSYLIGLGYKLTADGQFGVQTEDATKAFQRSRGLTADGIVGTDTLRATDASSPAPSSSASSPATTRLSAAGRKLIQRFEGLSLTAYRDATGYSIGYGHFGAQQGQTITQAEADRFFDADVARFEAAVAAATPRAEPHQFDAMVSLAYNVGAEAFSKSTVARRHNAGDELGAADAFLMWNQSDGKVLQVLEDRRERERAVYLHANYSGPIDGAGGAAPAAPSSPRGGGLAALLVLALGASAVVFFRWR